MSELDTNVEYRLIPGFTSYFVTNTGEIWSSRWKGEESRLSRISNELGDAYRLIKGSYDKNGYRKATLISDDGSQRIVSFHRMVLLAFVGPCPDGLQTRHLDGNNQNNNIDNLIYGTSLENAQDRIRHGTQLRGELLDSSKLTENEVISIREEFAAGGVSDAELSRKYNVKPRAIGLLLKGETWGHVGGPLVSRQTLKERNIPSANAKLTNELVAQIRKEWLAGGISKRELAVKYGVGKATIHLVVVGKIWGHVEGEVDATLASKNIRSASAKITAESAVKIREEYAAGTATQQQLAEKYGVGDNTICVLLQGKTWKHVGGPRANFAADHGVRSATAKLTEEIVVAIRQEYAAGGVTQKQLGDKYGVGDNTICVLLQGKTWSHVKPQGDPHESDKQQSLFAT